MCVCVLLLFWGSFLSSPVDNSRVFGVKTTGLSTAHSEMGGLAVAVGGLVCSTAGLSADKVPKRESHCQPFVNGSRRCVPFNGCQLVTNCREDGGLNGTTIRYVNFYTFHF